MAITCKMCGTANDEGVKFCSACGSELTKGEGEPKPAAKDKVQRAKTMMMGTSPVATMSAGDKKTSEGDKSPFAGRGSGIGRVSGLGTTSSGKPSAKGGAKTVLGMAAMGAAKPADAPPTAKASPAGPQKSPVKKEPAKRAPFAGGNRTMLGVASPIAKPQTTKAKATPSNPPMARAVPLGAQTKKPEPKPEAAVVGKKTMLGMPALGSELKERTSTPPPEEAPAPAPEPDPTEATIAAEPEEALSRDTPADRPQHREEPDEAVAREETPIAAGTMPLETATTEEEDYDAWPEETATAEEPKRSGLLIALVVIAVVVMSVGGVLAYLMLFGKGVSVTPQVIPSPDGKHIIVSLPLPKAPAGTTVRFGDQVSPVTAGQAQVTIPMSQLKLGSNNVTLSYVEPGGSVSPITFPIVLRHTIADDLQGLVSEKPFISVTFQVAPTVKLAVEGKPVQVASGAYVHKIPLETIMASAEPGGDQIMHSVSFQLTDQSGVAERGQHVVAVPITKLQVDRPADNALVQGDVLTCSGTTENGAQVTVNGSPVGVTAIGFSASVPLPQLGEHKVAVTARAPGKAPSAQTLTVNRIESFDSAIEQWSTDLDKSLDYPTIGRDPNAYSGKKIMLNGRVVNISTEKGVTAFILYVKEGCPARGKCAVYVVYRGETDAGLQSWVDVYGTVRGTRSVDLQQGLKIDVPAVDATFVVKSAQGKKKSKRRKTK